MRLTCDLCDALAAVFIPGTEPLEELFLLVREQPERRWCLAHARAAGWPWLASETTKRRGKAA